MNDFFSGFQKRAALKKDVELQPHQKRVLARAQEGQSLLLYHGLGSGKSLSSIAATEIPGKKVDVVVPAALRENYRKELTKFTEGEGPDRTIQSYEGARKGLPGGDFLVADEIQRINNPQAARSKAILSAAKKYKQRMVLSGTPIRNNPAELAPVINTINPGSGIPLSPDEFNTRFLEEKMVDPGFWNKLVHKATPGVEVQPKNLKDIAKAVHGHVDYHMPSKSGYPSTSEQVVKVPMSHEQQQVYATVTSKADPFVAWKVRHNMPLSKQEAQNLNSFMTAARIVSNTTAPYGGKNPSPKLMKASEDVSDMLKKVPNGKALVYSNYLEGGVKEYSKHLAEKNIPHHIFTGELSDKKRKQMVEDYNSGKVQALLISGAGAEGLDLKGTRLVQVLEPHWNKARIDQAIGRAVRYRSHDHLPEDQRHVHIVHYHATIPQTLGNKIFKTKQDTSADEFLYNLSQKKEKINQAFLDVLKSEGERASKEWEKSVMEKSAFEIGFEKAAGLLEDHEANTTADALIGQLPFGTTLSTAFGKRPEGHSRLREWGARVGGSVVGSVGGSLIGSGLGALTKKPALAAALTGTSALAGGLAGEGFGSYWSTKKHYDDKGKLIDYEKKTAAARSEILNTSLNPANWTLSVAATPLGVAMGPYSEEDRKKVNEKSWSNLIPGVAPYRLGRRAAGIGLDASERPK